MPGRGQGVVSRQDSDQRGKTPVPLKDELASEPNNGETPRRRASFRRKCNIAAIIGGLMAAALAPVDIASWAGDSRLHLHPQQHVLVIIAICLLVAPALGRWVVRQSMKEVTQEWVTTEARLVDRIVNERLRDGRDEIINVITDLVHELIHDIEPRQQHLIEKAVRNALRPQITEIKRGVADGWNAATRAGLIAGAKQDAQQRTPRRRGQCGGEDATVPTIGTVRRFRPASNDQ